MKMRVLVWGFLLATALFAAEPPPRSYEAIKGDAEKAYAEGSFARAHELYAQARDVANLSPAEARWAAFRLADTQWRSAAATEQSDTTKLDEARRQLEVLVRDRYREEERDRVWAEAEESLGDFHWARRGAQDWSAAWQRYEAALNWWAGAPDIELARKRYLAIVWRMARPPRPEPYYDYGSFGNYVPLKHLENALKIAEADNDKARAHYLIAMTLRNQGDWEQRARIPEEFEAAIKAGRTSDWYDDALYQYAEWMAHQGRAFITDEGGWRMEPDYVRALELFRRITREFNKGETRYYDQALQQIRSITEPQISVSVQNVFLPGSEIQYHLGWRNVDRVELELYAVDLTRDIRLSTDERRDWLHSIELGGRERIRSWTYDPGAVRTNGAGGQQHRPGSAALRLEGKLAPGAYVLHARGGGLNARDLVLVTDTTLVLKTSGRQALAYLANAVNSTPVSNATVWLWERWHQDNRWHVRDRTMQTGPDGVAVFELSERDNNHVQLFIGARFEDRQAFSPGYGYWNRGHYDNWKIYAFTDRPAYRPKETANWKFVVRRYNGSVYSTPGDEVIEYEITDPRGTKVKSDKVTLNAFGSAFGSLELTEPMPLGEYSVQFWANGRRQHIGQAQLFRLEEYKLPEFKVTVQTPEEDGRRKSFRLGETVEATVQADYYFGGSVANAMVEVLVYQNPFHHYWRPPRDYPWFYEDIDSAYARWYGRGPGHIIKREVLKTDAGGKATLSFETPRNNGQDLEYRIEARVTDSSRREVIGSGTVRVTRQRYYVYAHPDHCIYRPQDQVKVTFKALDANEQPVQADGIVKVTRDYWFEVWLAPDGREVKGDELMRIQSQSMIWPPLPPRPDQPGWRLKFRGYQHDDILTRALKTDTNGVAELEFTPQQDGYYRIAWTSEDKAAGLSPAGNKIRSDTAVWVATGRTTELGYRHGGVQIILDKDTFRAGQRAPVMLAGPTSDRHVLFTVEGEEMLHYQVVHLEGTVKLVEFPVEEKHVPNIFLSAVLVHDRQIFNDTKQVIVPPTRNFLTVDVQSDRLQYEPREEGTLTVTTRDHEGRPVSAEVALSVVDESVFYIQSDLAGDPRQFYFGTKRGQHVQTQSTMHHKSYVRLVQGYQEELVDELELDGLRTDVDEFRNHRSAREGKYYLRDFSVAGGAVGSRRTQDWNGAARLERSMFKSAATMSLNGASQFSADMAPLAAAAPAEVGAQAGAEPAVQVRTDFRSTVLWQPDVVTDKNGRATVKVKYPESLTSWKATARVVSRENQFGLSETNTGTRQPLIVRLQAPRFFVVGDSVTLSAVVNNNTEAAMDVRVALDAAGLKVNGSRELRLSVPAHGEARADWSAEVAQAGEVKLKVTGRGGKHADGMEKTYLAYEHGIEKFLAKSGKARGGAVTINLELPRERKAGSSSLTVQVTPSLAVTMLDALPYLIDYPYGCTEQTMSRFLPAVITAKTLRDLGLEPADVMGRVFGGIERSNAAATHPRGSRDLKELDAMVKAGLERLYDFQHGDGGWGWWREGESDHWMSAYVVWGLTLARDAGVAVHTDVLDRGAKFLDLEIVEEEENHDMQAFMLHALAVHHARANRGGSPSAAQSKAFDNLWRNREKLNAYSRALLALAAHGFARTNEAKILVANLENGVKRDDRPDTSVLIQPDPSAPDASLMGTAHWGADGLYWRWSEGGIEATAFALRALLAIDPGNKLIEPVSNWLIRNRRGAQWTSTRDTAIVVLAMNDYLRTSGELKGDIEYELLVNGSSIAKKKITGAEVFQAPSRFNIDPQLIRDRNDIRIRRTSGNGSIYFAAEAKFFSLEEPITAAGSEIFVKRQYFKVAGRPTLLKGYVYEKVPLNDGETVRSGERVEVLLTIEGKNDYEYLIFEDLKPAGFEAVAVRSGESLHAQELKSGAVERKFTAAAGAQNAKASTAGISLPRPRPQPEGDHTGRSRWVYQELRDRKVAMFIDKLPEGVWEIRYELRAEVPGKFHALPVIGQAMYVPEIRCNGAEVRVTVVEAPSAR